MSIEHIRNAMLEVLLFLITVVILFNTYSDFAIKVGIAAEPLQLWHIQVFGFVATFTAIINSLSDTFFGFRLVH